MEHRKKKHYLGYDIDVFISHEGDLFVDVVCCGQVIKENVGNVALAQLYIEDLIFEASGIQIDDSADYMYRMTREDFTEFKGKAKVKELAIGSYEKKIIFLANPRECSIVGKLLGQVIPEGCFDYIKVYWR